MSKTESDQAQAAALSAENTSATGPSLGKRLKIRSMVHMAGEVLPFFWPMRNFIHHNPLHGLEHLPFEQAVSEATHLFHARGYLKRVEYQQLMARGSIEPDVVEELVAEFVARWLAEHDRTGDADLADLLQRCLVAMLTRMSQPAPGDDVPGANEVLAGLRRSK
ncbi:MAG: putative inorganic carbon transporter subunit DabA [Thiohalocapsa sp.]